MTLLPRLAAEHACCVAHALEILPVIGKAKEKEAFFKRPPFLHELCPTTN